MSRKDRILKVYNMLNIEDSFEKIAGQKEDLLISLKAARPDDFRNNNLEEDIKSIVEDPSFIGWFRKNYVTTSGETHALADSIITLKKYKEIKSGVNNKIRDTSFLSKIFESEKFSGFDNKKEEEKRSFISNLQNLSIDQMQHIVSLYYGGKVLVNVDVEIDESKERVGKVGEWNVWLPHTKDTSAKIAGYDPITYEPKTDWCTARTTGSNLFYDYVGRKDEIVFLFYIIKDNPVARPKDQKKDNDWMSIGYIGSSYGNSDLKPYLAGRDGLITVNRSNVGLVEEDFIETLGQETWAAVKRIIEAKIKSLNKVNPAKAIVEGLSKNLIGLKKEVSKKSGEERLEFLSTILKYSPSEDVLRYIATAFAKDKPEEFFSNSKFKELIELEKAKLEENSRNFLQPTTPTDVANPPILMIALKNLAEKSPSIYFSPKMQPFLKLIFSKSQGANTENLKQYFQEEYEGNNSKATVSLAKKDPKEFYTKYLQSDYSITPEVKDLITLELISSSLTAFSESDPVEFIKKFDNSINQMFFYNPGYDYFKRLLDKIEKVLKDPSKSTEEKALAEQEKVRIESLKNGLLAGARKKLAETQPDQYFTYNINLIDPDPANISLAISNVAKDYPSFFFHKQMFNSEFSTPENNIIAADNLAKKHPFEYFRFGVYKKNDIKITSQAFVNLASNFDVYGFFKIRKTLKSEGYNFPELNDKNLIETALKNISSVGTESNVLAIVDPELKKEMSEYFDLDISNFQESVIKKFSNGSLKGYFSLSDFRVDSEFKYAYQNPENWEFTKEAVSSAVENLSPTDLISQFKEDTYRKEPHLASGYSPVFGSALNFVIKSKFANASDIAEIFNAFLLKVSNLVEFAKQFDKIIKIIPEGIRSLIKVKEAILSKGEGGILSAYLKDTYKYFGLPDDIIFAPDNLELTIKIVDRGIINSTTDPGLEKLKLFLSNYLGNENPNAKYTKLRKLNLTQVDELAKQGIRKVLNSPGGEAFFEKYKSDPLVDEVIIEVLGSRSAPEETPAQGQLPNPEPSEKSSSLIRRLTKLATSLDSMGYNSYNIKSIIRKIS